MNYFQFFPVPLSVGAPGSVWGYGESKVPSGLLWRHIVVWGKWVRALPSNVFLAWSGRWTDILWWGLKSRGTPWASQKGLSFWDTLRYPEGSFYPVSRFEYPDPVSSTYPLPRPGRVLDFFLASAPKGQSPSYTSPSPLGWTHATLSYSFCPFPHYLRPVNCSAGGWVFFSHKRIKSRIISLPSERTWRLLFPSIPSKEQ